MSLSTRLLPNRNTLIAIAVVGFHLLAVWALQTGLLRRAAELIVPAQILSEFIEPPAPKVVPPPPPPPPLVKQPMAKTPVAPPAPQLVAIADPTPAPNAPTGITTPQPPPPPVAAAVVATPAPAPAAAPAPPPPPKVELPSTNADYLQNPKPVYPAMSKRLNEQGKVLVRVLIGADGVAQKSEIRQSSGFERLDQSAQTTVMLWRYVPGKRAGVPEAMWFVVPISFVLE